MEIVQAFTQLGPAVERGGVVALLLLMLCVLAWDWWRLRKELGKVYTQRDRALLSLVKCKTTLEANKIAIDLRDIEELLPKPNGAG